MTFISYAQNFEDVMLWRALQHLGKGFYLDVGAGHPDDYSVTRAFYDRGWNGINIEPTSRFGRLSGARSRDINLQIAVGAHTGELTLYTVEGNADISTIDPAIAERHRSAGWTVGESVVQIETLAEICERHVRSDVHFLKIDAEGAERDVLLGADFNRFRPWIVVAEATAPNSQIATHEQWEDLLLTGDYRFAWFDGLNRFYVAAERWQDLSPALSVPPNVFDDFIRAADTEYAKRIIEAEVRTAHAEAAVGEALRQAAAASERAAQAEMQAQQADMRTQQADMRAQQADMRAQQADMRTQQAECQVRQALASAAQAEARAQRAASDTVAIEHRMAELTTRHEAALQQLAAIRASTTWRIGAPLRAVGRLLGR